MELEFSGDIFGFGNYFKLQCVRLSPSQLVGEFKNCNNSMTVLCPVPVLGWLGGVGVWECRW